jgi:hypothetical protein
LGHSRFHIYSSVGNAAIDLIAVDILIGSTGFVGSTLLKDHLFDRLIHRPNASDIQGARCGLLVCAGLPAEKWRVNADPNQDWENMAQLAQLISTTTANQAVLISTIDVFQSANNPDEDTFVGINEAGKYGSNRAWFEMFFRAKFPTGLIVRLPGLFSPDLRKNLIYDLMHKRLDQLQNVSPKSEFQYFDVTQTWSVIEKCIESDIRILNVATEPISAEKIAQLFNVELRGDSSPVYYDVRTKHDKLFGGESGYIRNSTEILAAIKKLVPHTV